ncbi:AMP-binding protein [Serratia marcescens]|uniref:AMP-binding protein n=1 Tax=Serratia marcescens TaxID=615 RepID=UPI003ED8F20F
MLRSLRRISICCPAAERELLLYGWNRTAEVYPAQSSAHVLFEQWAQRTPDAVAVVNDRDSLSYAQLNAHANQLAHQLIAQGVRPGDRVATSLERSVSLVIAQLAILKAGAAYVPLDPHLPVARQAWIIGDSGASLILCDRDIDREIAGEIACLRIEIGCGRIRPTIRRCLAPATRRPTSCIPRARPVRLKASW